MTKAPEPGQVKTRLAANIGDDHALQVHESLLKHVRRLCLDAQQTLGWSIRWQVAPSATALTWAEQFVPGGQHVSLQQGNDLGNRMRHAFADAFEHETGVAIMIGCDCPEIDLAYLQNAAARLQQHTAVFGPTHDGGYVLIGLREPRPELFCGPQWGSADVLETSIRIAAQSQISYALLPTCSDLDTINDLSLFPALDPRISAN